MHQKLVLLFVLLPALVYGQWNGAASTTDYASLIYRDGNIQVNSLYFGRYGSSIVSDPNPFLIASPANSGEHDLLLFGSNNESTLHLRLLDGNLKLGLSTNPNTILYNNGVAFFGNNVGIGINGALARLQVAEGSGGEQIRISRGTGAVRFSQESNKDNLFLYNKDAPLLYMLWKENGNVGVGTSNPQAKFHVGGHLLVDGDGVNQIIYTGTGSSELNKYLSLINSPGLTSASGLKAGGVLVSDTYSYANPGKSDLVVKGNVSIGTPSSHGFKLAIAGKAIAEEVVVQLTQNWPDYVFDNEYKLISLSELEQYIIANRHLPDVPTAHDVNENGLSLGEMNAILLKKVEELTLYVLELKRENDESAKVVSEMRDEIEALKAEGLKYVEMNSALHGSAL